MRGQESFLTPFFPSVTKKRNVIKLKMGRNSNIAVGPQVYFTLKTHHTLYIGGVPGKLKQINLLFAQVPFKSFKYKQ